MEQMVQAHGPCTIENGPFHIAQASTLLISPNQASPATVTAPKPKLSQPLTAPPPPPQPRRLPARPPPLATIARAAALRTPARLLLLGRMASSASAAALLVQPFPSSSDSDDPKLPPPPPPPARPCSTDKSDSWSLRRLERAWRSLERDCNVRMKALARAGEVDEVVGLFAELRDSAFRAGVAPSVLCYNTHLNALAEAGRVGEVDQALGDMDADGVPPNVSTLNILVKLHAWRFARFDKAYKAVLELQGKGVEPDVGTYSTFITGLCRAGRLGEARVVLDWMLEAERCPIPMVHTYTPIVQGYCREGRIEEAKKLIDRMECKGCPANVVTYNVLIRALCEEARFDEVKDILAESGTKGWKPSTVTYNTYMNGLCKQGMAEEALQQLDIMLGEGLDPTMFTFSIILNCHCHNSMVSKAISLLEGNTGLDSCAGVVAYNTVMSRLRDLGRWWGVLKLFTNMIKRGITPNTRTFNILIHSLCIAGKSSIAKSLVFNQEFAANVVTYNTLIDWFYKRGKLSEVKNLLAHMVAAKIAPDEVTLTIWVCILCREENFDEATRCFLTFLESGFSRDLLTVLMNRLVHNGRIWEIVLIFRKMKKEGKGFPPDYSIFDYTINSCCKVGFCHSKEIFRLGFILDAMLGLEVEEEVNFTRKSQGKR